MRIPELYKVQESFIKECKSVIQKSNIGIFSSPTGTGKTLSLLLSVVDYISEDEDYDPLLEDIFGSSMSKTKIYFCSRTHSQLRQCINEFKNLDLQTNSVIMGSRKIYCINREINNKENIDKINNKCRDLIKEEKCEFYKNDIFTKGVLDIEELVKEGRRHHGCPYYFVKKYFKKCELVFLPYSVLFNEESRDNLKIDLQNSIVIVDEAHNIIEAVNSINTKIIYFDDIEKYILAFEKYSKILNKRSKNKENILTLIEIFKNILKYKNQESKIISVNTFLFDSNLLHYNMLDIEDALKKNNVLTKIESYGRFLNYKIYEIIKFLNLLVNSDTNCKIEISSTFLRIFPIDSKLYFEPFLDCQSVIFAGGTMEPIKHLKDIFSNRVVEYYFYDSIATNFLGFIISQINLNNFELTEKTRDTDLIRKGLRSIILELLENIDKGGIVIFVPSKYYLEMIRTLIYPADNFYFENIHSFEDYKDNLVYGKCVLFAVMGGRLSEGMNFNDDLCRILVILGIPFPNLTNEIEEKIKYFGRDFYLQMAMKKINQTIGRAIRHKKDYASIFLIDFRYLKYKNELSPWFRKKVRNSKFNDAVKDTKNFLNKFG
jgi:chromosome transmission fidelity protein 1